MVGFSVYAICKVNVKVTEPVEPSAQVFEGVLKVM